MRITIQMELKLTKTYKHTLAQVHTYTELQLYGLVGPLYAM